MGILEEWKQQETYYADLEKISKSVVDEECRQMRQKLETKRSKCTDKNKIAEIDDLYKELKWFFFYSEVIAPYCQALEYIRKNKKWDTEFIAKLILSDGEESYPEGNAYDLYDRIAEFPIHWKNIFIAVFNSVSIRCANAIASGNSKQDFVEGCSLLETAVFNKILSYANMLFYGFDLYSVVIDEDMSCEDYCSLLNFFSSKFSISNEYWNPITKFCRKLEKREISLSDCIDFLKFYIENSGIPIQQLEEREKNILDSILRHPSFMDIYEMLTFKESVKEEIDFSNCPVLVEKLKPEWKENGNLTKLADFVVEKMYIGKDDRNSFIYLFSGDPTFAPTDKEKKPYFTWNGGYEYIMYIVKYISPRDMNARWKTLQNFIAPVNSQDPPFKDGSLIGSYADRPGKNSAILKFFTSIDSGAMPADYTKQGS